jgi:(2R)-3-sulfolactate dehydrogenase (NADP+)
MERLTVAELRRTTTGALLDAGASVAVATSLVEATLSAEQFGRREVGLSHLLDYIESLRSGRIDGQAEPSVEYPLPAFIRVDAKGGIAQLGFDLAFSDLEKRAKTFGIAVFTQRDSYTAGELGYYVRRLAQRGLIGMASANAHAMMATGPGGKAVYSTNPFAFAVPLGEDVDPLVIDQASSATAFVNIKQASNEHRAIPEGWAIDAEGRPTTDASEAILGALLPFGGFKGANIALTVEMLSAGLSGAMWSLDAGKFHTGQTPPGIGLTVIAISPAGDGEFAERARKQCHRLADHGVHIPGTTRRTNFDPSTILEVETRIFDRLFKRSTAEDGAGAA